MKTKQTEQSKLSEGGRDSLERTSEFRKKVDEIRMELTDKYALAILNEKNWVKRLLIKVKLQIEIRKKINELTSSRNLHVVGN